ncbi:MAG TPA: hypothetical protein VJP78_09675 [Thermoleophilia bacterium]|nr:hypothetical protein [Thermoleophilia bacterium]
MNGLDTSPLDEECPRTTAEIERQLGDLAKVKAKFQEYGTRDNASIIGLESLLKHEAELSDELRAANLLESTADAEFSLDGEPIWGNAAPAALLGDFLRLLQSLTYAVAQVLAGQPTQRARVRGDLVAENRMLVMPGFVAGSFSVRIRLPNPAELGQLFIEPQPDRVLSEVRTLLTDPVQASTVMEMLAYPRVKTYYADLMELLARQNADVRIRTRSHPFRAGITPKEVRERLDWLQLLQVTEQGVTLRGTLTGGSIARDRFELKVGDEMITGRVSDAAKEQMKHLSWGDDVTARLRVLISEHEERKGQTTTTYFAEAFTR